ncbi:MAG: GNAT family N-acetyltransferase [Actinomycetota bacterium]|nr:GNAT family N-acetyltransferase [Actinomycetota bacterium]
MHVRERTHADLDSCERLARVVHELDGYPPRLPCDLRRFIASADAIGAWVAEHDRGIVGHVALHRESSEEVMALAAKATGLPRERLGVIVRLLVAPSVRRMGAGRALLSVASGEAISRGLWPILDVATHFGPAINLYENTGWKCAGRVTVPIRGAESLDEYVYIGPSAPDA